MASRIMKTGIALVIALGLSGCSNVGEKGVSISAVYAFIAVISLILLIGCCITVQTGRLWFILLFSSVFVVNTGYALLSVATSLEKALVANRIAYLGSVFLPLAMFMIILGVTNTDYKKRLPIILFAVSAAVFLSAASPGILDIYYKEVSFQIIDGVAMLIKVYGPLHSLYLCYLLGYFVAMVAVIVRALVKKTVDNVSHAVILAIAVFVNIGVWLIEQMTDIDFEFLSVSYIISELFLIGVHLMMKENQRLKEIVRQKEADFYTANSVKTYLASAEEMDCFERGLKILTSQERQIFEAYINDESTKAIMARLNIKENTLKFHNKNLYGKLGVPSRKRLVEIYRAINREKQK